MKLSSETGLVYMCFVLETRHDRTLLSCILTNRVLFNGGQSHNRARFSMRETVWKYRPL